MPMLAYAQAHSGHAGHISEPSKTSTPAPASSVDHDSMNMSGMHHGDGEMDHGDMQMQGGSAPQDARDPDAYSDGYVRNAGKYALPPSDALMMSDTHNFGRSEEHTSELQSLMRISYAGFCLKKKNKT